MWRRFVVAVAAVGHRDVPEHLFDMGTATGPPGLVTTWTDHLLAHDTREPLWTHGCKTRPVTPLGDLARRFVRLGVLGFGGPAAHIAMMREEFVVREKWFGDDEFARMVGAVNLIPGPNSTELAMHIGQRRAGPRGLVVAGACFIVPAVVIVGTLAWLHDRHGTNPALVDLRWGVLPIIVAIVAHATWGLARSSLVSLFPFLVASSAVAAQLAGANELVVLVAAGVAGAIRGSFGASPALLSPMVLIAAAATNPSLLRILAVFVEIGAVLYGSGYVLVAFLEGRIVDQLGWLDATAVLDAVAVGQITPGPVFSTATFVGWQLSGIWGAAVATIGIFAPAFVFVGFLGRIVGWIESRRWGRQFLAGVVAASLGLMAGALLEIADVALVDGATIAIAIASFGALLAKVPATRLVVGGVALGLAHLVLT